MTTIPAARRRPVVFVGCLRQNADIAVAIQEGLDDVAEVTVSTQSIARLSAPILDSFLETLNGCDCAVFIFPEESISASADYRDALLQLGIMMGVLKRDRTFVVVPTGMGPVVVPTPLLGIGVAEYDVRRAGGNLRSAVGVATTLIRDALAQSGPRMRDEPRHDFPPSFEQHLLKAQSIYFWGMNQSDFLIQHFDSLRRRLSEGVTLRALLVAPKGFAVRVTRLRFSGLVETEHETFRSKSSLARLCQLHESFPELVTIKTLDYAFPYGAFLFNENCADAILYVKRYTFKTTGGSKKPKFVYESGRTRWFDLVSQEGEQLWEAASTWGCA